MSHEALGSQFARLHNAIRKNNPSALYGEGEHALHALTHTQDYGAGGVEYHPRNTTPVPWPQAHPHSIVRQLDPKVRGSWGSAPMEEVDPRSLHASQPSLTSTGLEHYFGAKDFDQLHDTTRGASNLHPIVYHLERPRQEAMNVLLSGHHRAATALMRGNPLKALVVRGGLAQR